MSVQIVLELRAKRKGERDVFFCSNIYWIEIIRKQYEKIAPCLWFDKEAEDAAQFYVSVFPNSKNIAHCKISNRNST